jgi:peptidoglycan hydrolase CwlO-like protein
METARIDTLRALKAQIIGDNAAVRGLRDRAESEAAGLAARLRGLDALVGSGDESAEARDERISALISRGLLTENFTQSEYTAAIQEINTQIQEITADLSKLNDNMEKLDEAVLASDEYMLKRVGELAELIEQVLQARDERELLNIAAEAKLEVRSRGRVSPVTGAQLEAISLLSEARDMLSKKALELAPENGSSSAKTQVSRLNEQIAKLNAAIEELLNNMYEQPQAFDEML